MTYVSVSGVAREHDMYELEAFAEKLEVGHALFFGIQATEKTQIQRRSNSRGHRWHPVGDEIYHSFSDREMSASTYGRYRRVGMRIVHFSYEKDRSDADCYFTTRTVLDRWPLGLAKIDGWQFNNLPWHQRGFDETVGYVQRRLPGSPLIGQLSSQVLANMSNDVIDHLTESDVSHVLLDSSGGTGRGFDLESYRRYIDMIVSRSSCLEVAIAGGMGADTKAMEDFHTLCAEFGPLSCDAEGQLRDYPDKEDPDYYAKSLLSLKKCREYITQALREV